jgi:hypothetical protein
MKGGAVTLVRQFAQNKRRMLVRSVWEDKEGVYPDSVDANVGTNNHMQQHELRAG